tara:strand:- start:1052 stop:2182 length:1131 start_codon:yes stop_codon:yes gene_type:complete
MISVARNKNYNPDQLKKIVSSLSWNDRHVKNFHQMLGNKETPILSLPGLASNLGIKKLLLKDESERLGLSSFKALGASYAMNNEIQKNPQIKAFCTATDGNHGKSVAWMSRKLGRKAIVFMPEGTVSSRINAIEKEGAEVSVISGGYDTAVKKASNYVDKENKKNHYQTVSLIQDTAWEGYEDIPLDIMRGYSTQVSEISEQIKDEKIDILFLQSGVGSWAASVIGYIVREWEHVPHFISVEPYSANCLYESIKTGCRVTVENDKQTNMAGLNCGSVSSLAWQILKNGLSGALSISDKLSEKAMKLLASNNSSNPEIVSGESGAAGLAGLIGLCETNKFKNYRSMINLNSSSSVLVINTEGDTDPINYQKVVRGIN